MNPSDVMPRSVASTQKVARRVRWVEGDGVAQNLYVVPDKADLRRSAGRSLWRPLPGGGLQQHLQPGAL